MWARIAGFFGLSVLQFLLIGGGIAAALIWFWNEKRVAYNNGYNAAVIECNERIRKETDRINTAQNEALTRAMELLTKILKEKDDLNVELDKLQDEAALDPDAAKCGLSIGGVRRTNRIR